MEGGIQLLVGSVLQDVADDGGIVPQGSPAFRRWWNNRFSFLRVRWAQDPQTAPPSWRAVDVELMAYFIIDGAKLCTEGRLRLLPKGFNTVPLSTRMPMYSILVALRTAGFDNPVNLPMPSASHFSRALRKLFRHAGLRVGRAERRAHAIIQQQGGPRYEIAGRGVQQVGGQLCAKVMFGRQSPWAKRRRVQRLCVETKAVSAGFLLRSSAKNASSLKPRGI